MWLNDQRNMRKRIEEKALKEGMAKGRAEGIMEGIAKGIAEGERLTRLAMAKGLLAKLSEAEIAQLTGLPLVEIQAMKA